MSITNEVLENLPQNRDNFLNEENIIYIYIFLDPFFYAILCDQKWDKLSVNIECLMYKYV